MKHVLIAGLITCLVLAMALGAAACFTPSSPNVRVQFTDPANGWIVGPRLLRTSNGGRSWEALKDRGPGTFQAETLTFGVQSTQFINGSIGVQLQEDAFYKTVDGGLSWVRISQLPKGKDKETMAQTLFFISPEKGWIFGESIYHTVDGGKTWSRLASSPTGERQRLEDQHMPSFYADCMPAVWFTKPLSGVMARLDGDIYATADGGTTWTRVARFDQRINDVVFTDGNNGWIVGNQGLMARTSNGGREWKVIPSGTQANLKAVSFRTLDAGCAVGEQGTIICTKDNGSNWEQGSIEGLSQPFPTLASISLPDALEGWAVGGRDDPMFPSLSAPSNVILTTNDGGKNWRTVEP